MPGQPVLTVTHVNPGTEGKVILYLIQVEQSTLNTRREWMLLVNQGCGSVQGPQNTGQHRQPSHPERNRRGTEVTAHESAAAAAAAATTTRPATLHTGGPKQAQSGATLR